MAGLLDTLSEDQTQVCRHLPYPIAVVWQQVLQAPNAIQVQARLHTQVEVVARFVGVVLLCDYLRGPADPAVEGALDCLHKPEPEDWLALIGHLCEALQRRTDPPVMVQPLVGWRRRRAHADRDGLQQLSHVMTLRKQALVATELDESFEASRLLEDLLQGVLDLLESLRFLGAWRLLRIVDLTTLRHKGFAGRVQVFAGGGEAPEPIDATWTAHLVTDAVYLVDPQASQFLELSPLVRVLPHPRTRRPLCFVFAHAEGLQRPTLVHDPSGVLAETSIAGAGGEVALVDWLAMRQQHGAWQANQDTDKLLCVDPNAQRYLAAKRTLPGRPISGLSQLAFAGSRGSSLFGKSRRISLGVQVALAVVVVGAAAVLLAPRSARRAPVVISDEAAAPLNIHADAQAVAAAEPATAAATVAAGAARPEPAAAGVAAPAPAPAPAASVPGPVPVPVVPAPSAVAAAAPAAEPAPVPEKAQPQPAQPAATPPVAAAPPPVAAAPPPARAPARAAGPAVVAAPAQPPAVAPRPPAPVAAEVAAPAGEDPGGDYVRKGLRDLAERPSYAVLKFLQARADGDRRADGLLARAWQTAGQSARCRHHALLACAAQPGNPEAEQLARACGGDPTRAAQESANPEDTKNLGQRLYQEGYAIIYGDRHSKSVRRRMAKEMYADAAARGVARGYTGLAQIYLFGETNRARCLATAQKAVAAGERGEAERLVKLCGG